MDGEERDEHPREQRGWPFRKEEGHEYRCACVRLCVFLLQLAASLRELLAEPQMEA